MSGVARSNSRRGRAPQSPYARPKPLKKQSSWGMSTIWNFLSAMGLHDRKTQEEEDIEEAGESSCLREEIQEESEMEVQEVLSAPKRTAGRYNQATPSPTSVAPASPQPAASATDSILHHATPGRSPAKAQEQVVDFLLKKGQDGTPLSEIEVQGMISLLNKGTDKGTDETMKPETFRFSTTPSTPARSPQPEIFGSPSPVRQLTSHSTSLPTFTNKTASTPRGSPKKQLSRNPNGEYRWVGGGSARTSHSPNRRTTPNRSPNKADGKRRRVDDGNDASISNISSTSVAQPAASTSKTESPSGLFDASTSHTTPQRIPRPVLRPKTAPVHPSPLRQVINGASPPGSPPSLTRDATSSPQKTPSRAAAVFSEIIEKVTPPPKPDVSNPYQTASPVKPLPKPKERRRMTDVRAKEIEKAKEKEVKKEEGLPSPKTIIEATVPKGAKRTRPPPNVRRTPLAKSLSPESRLFGPRDDDDSVSDAMEVEEPKDADEQVTPTKRQRTVEIEEVDDDVEMNISADKYEVFEPSDGFLKPSPPAPFSATPAASSNAQLNGNNATSSPSIFGSNVKGMPFAKSSLPTQPSKLRASFTAEEDDLEEIKASSKKTEMPKMNGISNNPKETALRMDIKALPTFVFQVSATVIDPKFSSASVAAKVKPLSALPTFDLFKPVATTSALSSAPSTAAPSVFKTAADAQKSADAWTCSECMLKNPASATESCTVCEAPRPSASKPAVASSTSSAPVIFTTAAAAQKSADTWECSECMLKNPASATEKCTICEAPRSAAPSSGATAAIFTTAAAAQQSTDSWTCSMCMLKNPASAKDKCTICENPRS